MPWHHILLSDSADSGNSTVERKENTNHKCHDDNSFPTDDTKPQRLPDGRYLNNPPSKSPNSRRNHAQPTSARWISTEDQLG
ncbi:hypothetical protein FQN57_000486 [Myotisia sp. PD_48]|nr:hypothetical protein FQN57_000486 [Myotisia sp. PD_48]